MLKSLSRFCEKKCIKSNNLHVIFFLLFEIVQTLYFLFLFVLGNQFIVWLRQKLLIKLWNLFSSSLEKNMSISDVLNVTVVLPLKFEQNGVLWFSHCLSVNKLTKVFSYARLLDNKKTMDKLINCNVENFLLFYMKASTMEFT